MQYLLCLILLRNICSNYRFTSYYTFQILTSFTCEWYLFGFYPNSALQFNIKIFYQLCKTGVNIVFNYFENVQNQVKDNYVVKNV